MNSYKPFIPIQSVRYVKLGVSIYAHMHPECLSPTGEGHFCDAGYELEIFKILMLLLNITIEIKYSTVPGCGHMYDNGTFDGLLEMLRKREIDVIGNLCQVDYMRTNVSWLKYSWPVVQQKQAFLIKAPLLNHSFQLLGPFSTPVWLCFNAVTFIFFTLFAVTYKMLNNPTTTSALRRAFKDLFSIIFGFDTDIVRPHWFYCICCMGFGQLLYSTLVTTVVLKPADIKRPFHNHMDLADALLSGKYKILDYNRDPFIRCYSAEECQKISTAFETNKAYIFNTTSLDNVNATNDMLQLLLDDPQLVMVKGRHNLLTYLNKFPKRSQLWLIDDRESGLEWFSYFYHNNFEMSTLFNQALILMGDSKDNIYGWYSKLSSYTIQSKKISGRLSEKTKFNLHMFQACFFAYFVLITLSMFVFLSELLLSALSNVRE